MFPPPFVDWALDLKGENPAFALVSVELSDLAFKLYTSTEVQYVDGGNGAGLSRHMFYMRIR